MKKITFYQLIGRIKKGTQPRAIWHGAKLYFWEDGAYLNYTYGFLDIFITKEDLEDYVEYEVESK